MITHNRDFNVDTLLEVSFVFHTYIECNALTANDFISGSYIRLACGGYFTGHLIH